MGLIFRSLKGLGRGTFLSQSAAPSPNAGPGHPVLARAWLDPARSATRVGDGDIADPRGTERPVLLLLRARLLRSLALPDGTPGDPCAK